MSRSSNMHEMVIRALIREYEMGIDTAKYRDLKLSSGRITEDFKEATVSWLKTALGAALLIFGWKVKKAIDGLGEVTDTVTKAATAVADTASKVGSVISDAGSSVLGAVGAAGSAAASAVGLEESRLIREAKIVTRFVDKSSGAKLVIESDVAMGIAESFINGIDGSKLGLTPKIPTTIAITMVSDINKPAQEFNEKAKAKMKSIIELCSSPSRSYPASLSPFSIASVTIPKGGDLDENERMLLGFALLDVAAIALTTFLQETVIKFYANMKDYVDENYGSVGEEDENEALSDELAKQLDLLTRDLSSMITSAKVEKVLRAD